MPNKTHLLPLKAIHHVRSAAARAALDFKLKHPELRGEEYIPRAVWVEMTKQNTIKRLCNMFPGTTPEEAETAFNKVVEFYEKVPYVDEPEHRKMLDKLWNTTIATLLTVCLVGFGIWLITNHRSTQPNPQQNNQSYRQ